MKLLCPTCQKPLEVPEQYAGQMMKCPLCNNTFTVPVLAQMPAAPPPAPPPPPPPPPPSPAYSAAAHGPGAAYQEPADSTGPQRSLSVNPRLIPWLAPLSLLIIFILLFLPWVGMYPGGVGVVTQTGWGAAFGSTQHDEGWYKYSTDTRAKYWEKYYGSDVEPLTKPGVSILLIFFILILLPAVGVSLVSVAVTTKLVPLQVPPPLQPFWPMRSLFVGGLALAAFVFLLLELFYGFPLEHKARTQVETAVDVDNKAATPAEQLDKQRWEIERGIRLGGYVLRTTAWLTLVLVLNAVALLGCALEFWLERRGGQAMPHLRLTG